MSMGLMFWILMLIWFVWGAYTAYSGPAWPIMVNSLLIFILFLLLGWHAFGPPIHG